MKEIKKVEFPDKVIARLTGKTEEIRQMRYDYGVTAHFKMVDTCAAEFDAMTPYYYSCFDSLENEVAEDNSRKKVMVLGSGPIRIGQGIRFDYCSVHSTWAFERKGYETIIVNNNPETVSTDFDIANKLYFEPLTAEDVEAIVNLEHRMELLYSSVDRPLSSLQRHSWRWGTNPWNKCRECRCSRGQRALR
ncbi:MAG: hypothetical protein ACLTDF_10195 [Coprococcus sp.]